MRTISSSVLALLLALALGWVATAGAAEDFGTPVGSRHVYDRAGVLTPDEVRDLEARATAVERAGAPVIVYLRSAQRSQSQTQTDAGALMEAWDVQSVPDARDGLVMFLNLRPDDARHGEVGLYAGQRHARAGTLSERALDGIFDRNMRPALADGRLAEGIAAGLDAAVARLVAGPPQPSALQRGAADLARVPLNIVWGVLGAALAVWAVRVWQARPHVPATEAATTVLPAPLAPALAGALATGNVADAQIEATLLDLAARGALAIEPVGRKEVQVRLRQSDRVRNGTEQAVWDGVVAQADAQGTVAPKRVPKIRDAWPAARHALRADLEGRGWFDPRASNRRTGLSIGGALALVGAAVGGVLALIGAEPLGLAGPGLLFLAGVQTLGFAIALPSTTLDGEWAAVAWRGYRAGLKQARRVPEPLFDLGEALPYAVALGSAGMLDRHLKTASANGYAPAWFVRDARTTADAAGGFYPYWVGFHGAVGGTTGSGGAGSAGASSGGASGGGSF